MKILIILSKVLLPINITNKHNTTIKTNNSITTFINLPIKTSILIPIIKPIPITNPIILMDTYVILINTHIPLINTYIYRRCAIDTLWYVSGKPGSYQIHHRLVDETDDDSCLDRWNIAQIFKLILSCRHTNKHTYTHAYIYTHTYTPYRPTQMTKLNPPHSPTYRLSCHLDESEVGLSNCNHCGAKKWNILGDAETGYVLTEDGELVYTISDICVLCVVLSCIVWSVFLVLGFGPRDKIDICTVRLWVH